MKVLIFIIVLMVLLLVYGVFIQKTDDEQENSTREIDPPFGDNYH